MNLISISGPVDKYTILSFRSPGVATALSSEFRAVVQGLLQIVSLFPYFVSFTIA
jgi:hypothetical protein